LSKVDQLVNAALNRPGDQDGNMMLVKNFLTQMVMFGVQKGVEFYPEQDDSVGTRTSYIKKILDANEIELYLDRIWELSIADGQVLLFAFPSKDKGWSIRFYERRQFKAYYDNDGNINKAIIRYSYEEDLSEDMPVWGSSSTSFGMTSTKWVKLIIDPYQIKVHYSDIEPGLVHAHFPSYEVYENPFGYVPCRVINNNPTGLGKPGYSDFEPLASQIELLDDLAGVIRENLEFFSPAMVTSRRAEEVSSVISGKGNIKTGWADSQGFGGSNTFDRYGRTDEISLSSGLRVKKVIGGVQPHDRFGFISPDPITPDHNQYYRELRESLFFALGGIDELGLHLNATAYEIRTVYGKVLRTAQTKAMGIYTYGICKILEMIIAAEENIFRKSLAIALNKKEGDWVSDSEINKLMEERKIPQATMGLPPLGSRKITWRYKGEVFAPSTDEQLRKSIMVRNLQETGVTPLVSLTELFPNKTDDEKKGMLSGGYPFRFVNEISRSVQQLLGIYGQAIQMPDPNNPNAPLAFGTGIAQGIPVLVDKSLQILNQQLSYEKGWDTVSANDIPHYAPQYDVPNQWVSSPPASVSTPTSVPEPGTGASSSVPYPTSPLGSAGLSPIYPVQSGQPPSQPPAKSAIGKLPGPGSTVSKQPVANYADGMANANSIPAGLPISPEYSGPFGFPIWLQLIQQSMAAKPATTKTNSKSNSKSNRQ